MKTTTFAKIINKDTLWMITYFGEPTKPQLSGYEMKERFLLKSTGEKIESKDFPAGINTKVSSLDFETAMAESIENSTSLQKLWDEKAKEETDAKAKRVAALEAPLYEGIRGWYEVTMNYCILDMKNGGHKTKILNGRIIANNPMDAWEKACKEIYDTKQGFWPEPAYSALINYVGILTDEYLMNE